MRKAAAAGLLDETKAAWKMLFEDGIQTEKLPERGCLLADAAWIKGRETWLSQWAAGGGHLLIQGLRPGMEESIALLAGADIEILPETVWQFETLDGDFLRDISIADCYGMDLVHMCPRRVENRKLCEYTVQSGEGSMLAAEPQKRCGKIPSLRNIPRSTAAALWWRSTGGRRKRAAAVPGSSIWAGDGY